MFLKNLSNIIIKQAEEKGWGIRPKEINVPEKIALIHSEITEAYEAWQKNNIDGKDGFYEEISDALIRAIHLAQVFESPLEINEATLPDDVNAQIAQLHKITSQAYEKYRRKKEAEFCQSLNDLIGHLIKCGQIHRFDLEAEALKKIKHNNERIWDKDKLNEQLLKAG